MFYFAYSIPLYVTEIGLDLGAISLEGLTFELINFCLTNKKIPSHRFRTIWRSHHYCFFLFSMNNFNVTTGIKLSGRQVVITDRILA